MAGRAAIQVEGLREFRRELRSVDDKWPKVLKRAHQEAADLAAEYARGGADAEGGVVAKAAFSIRAAATTTGGRLRWGGRGFEFADGAFFGALQYQRFRPWIGQSWETGKAGEGPYGINDAIAARKDEIGEVYLDALEGVVAEVDAFREKAGVSVKERSFSIR